VERKRGRKKERNVAEVIDLARALLCLYSTHLLIKLFYLMTPRQLQIVYSVSRTHKLERRGLTPIIPTYKNIPAKTIDLYFESFFNWKIHVMLQTKHIPFWGAIEGKQCI